jgi:protein TonB
MRTYTLGFSIVVHLLVVAFLVVTPIVATDVPPQPRRAFDFVIVRPIGPLISDAPRGRGARRLSTRARDAAPTEAPRAIPPEPGIEHFESEELFDDAGVPGGVEAGGTRGVLLGEPTPPPAPPPRPIAPVRVGGSIRQPRKIRDAVPEYPPIARAARVEGVVILEAVIAEDGRVRDLRVLRSIPLLDQAAMDAVRRWAFTPTLLNGEPVPVVMTVTVAFTLR